MNNRDKICLEYILEHYQELIIAKGNIKFEEFCQNKILQKAILFDIAQISENINKLSDSTIEKINTNDIKGITGLRNHIIHGYGKLNEVIVWNAINIDLPNLVNQVKQILNDK